MSANKALLGKYKLMAAYKINDKGEYVKVSEATNEFEKFWNGIYASLMDKNTSVESIVMFRIGRFIDVFNTPKVCCREMENTVRFRLEDIHNEAVNTAKLYGLLGYNNEYPFANNYKDYLKKYVVIKED